MWDAFWGAAGSTGSTAGVRARSLGETSLAKKESPLWGPRENGQQAPPPTPRERGSRK